VSVLAPALVLTGCGGKKSNGVATANGTKPTASKSAPSGDNQDQGIKFAQCMRDHGVDMPDPQPNSPLEMNGKEVSQDKFKAAQEACKQFTPGGNGPAQKMNPQQVDQMRKYAKCMRDHGVDFPDPDSEGHINIKANGSGNAMMNPDDPTFKKAQEACRSQLPTMG
jgi:aspartyl-tRNA synthetase